MVPWWTLIIVAVAACAAGVMLGGSWGYMAGWEDAQLDVKNHPDDGAAG